MSCNITFLTNQHNKKSWNLPWKSALLNPSFHTFYPKYSNSISKYLHVFSFRNINFVLKNFAKTSRRSTFCETTLAKPPSCINQAPLHDGKTIWADKPFPKHLDFHISGWIFQKLLPEIKQKGLISNRRNFGLFAPKSMRFPSKGSKSKGLSF